MTALAVCLPLVGCSSEKAAENAAVAPAHDMANMPGMAAPVTIPKGAIFTAADVGYAAANGPSAAGLGSACAVRAGVRL